MTHSEPRAPLSCSPPSGHLCHCHCRALGGSAAVGSAFHPMYAGGGSQPALGVPALTPSPLCCDPSPPPGFEFFEASAKDNINVKQTFERLVDIICEKMSESLDAADPAITGAKQGPQLSDQQAPPHQDCAC